MKYFRFPVEHVLWQMSYANVNMYLATIPSHESGDEKKKKEDDKVEEVSTADLAGFLGF